MRCEPAKPTNNAPLLEGLWFIEKRRRALYFDLVYGDQPGWASIVVHDEDGKPTIQRWFHLPDERERMESYVEARNDEDVFNSMALFSDKERTTRDEDAVAHAVGVDADTCHPDNFRVPPTIRVKTGENRWHCWWVLDEAVPALEAALVAKRISACHESQGCDRPFTHNAAKILRVPGTGNSKHSDGEYMWEVEAEYGDDIYTLDTLNAVYEDIPVGALAAKQEAVMSAAEFDESVFSPDDLERLREYARVAWENDLVALEQGMVPGSWHTTGYKIACNMFRNANVPWSPYNHRQVTDAVTAAAQVDSPSSQKELDRILSDALKEVGSDSLAMPSWALEMLPDRPPEAIRGKAFSELEERLKDLNLGAEYVKGLRDTETATSRTLSLSRALFAGGLNAREVYSLMLKASANTHKNKRPASSVWADVQHAMEDPEQPHADMPLDRMSFLEPHEREYLDDNPCFVDDFVAWVASKTDAPTTFARSLAWMVLSSAYAGRGYLRFKYGPTPLNLWLLLVGETTTRKSTAKNLYLKLVHRFEAITGEKVDIGSDATAEAIIQTLGKRDGKTSLIHIDEVQGFFRNIYVKNYASGTLEVFTELYDGNVRVSLRATQGAGNSQRARTQFLLFGLGIRSAVAEILTKSNFESGFLARALWCVGEPSKEALEADAFEFEDPNHVEERDEPFEAMAEALADRYMDIPEPLSMYADVVSTKRMNKWVRDLRHMADQVDGGHTLQAVAQRLSESVMKAAALLALHEGSDTVTLRHALFALRQAELWVKDMLLMLQEVSSSEFERRLAEVEQYIASGKNEGRTDTEVRRHFTKFRPQEYDEIIRSLTGAGRIRKKPNDDRKRWEVL